MRRSFTILSGVLLAAALLLSCCQGRKPGGTVEFRGRQVDLNDFLTTFPYSTWGFVLSDDASKLFYLRNGETSPLVMLDLSASTDLADGQIICDDDFSKKSFWHAKYNEREHAIYWAGDERNDEIINLRRLDLSTGRQEVLTDVPYIYGWDFNQDKTQAAYIARLGQNEQRLDELHLIDLATKEDRLVFTDNPDFRMTWSEVALSPDAKGAVVAVLKNADRTWTNMAYLDFETGKMRILTDPAKEGSLDGAVALTPWYSNDVAYFTSDQTGYANIYRFDRKTGQVRQITFYEKQGVAARWIEAGGRKLLMGVRTSPVESVVSVIDPDTGAELAAEHYPVTLTFMTSTGRTGYFSAGATNIPFQIWKLSYTDGSLQKEVVLDLPEPTRRKMVSSVPERLEIPTFDIDPATGKTRLLHAYLMTPEHPLPKDEAIVMVMSFYGGENAYDMEHQIFTRAGMYVLSPSPRGSSGFGRDFAALNDHDLGGNETLDMIACGRFISEYLGIPPERVGCFGMSHGGYETMRLMTFPGEVNGHKDSFPYGFGVAVAGFSDIILEHEHSNIPDWTYLEAGDPATEHDKLMDRSPISHVDKITGPLLLIHGTHDNRVHPGGSQLMYDALKAAGKPVEYLKVEGQGHGFKGFENQKLYYETIFDFIEKYVK